MNAMINVKTAEKRLQFGVKKCKSMYIGKNVEDVLNNHLVVDKWTPEHKAQKIVNMILWNI